MRALAAACLLFVALAFATPARAEDASVSAQDHRAIERVITSQLEAFRRDAGDSAFGYASPSIQSMFGDASHFMAMVREGYPPVYRSRSATFERLDTQDGRIVQSVRLVGPDGAAALALYTMEQEADGTWRIAGCALTRPSDITT